MRSFGQQERFFAMKRYFKIIFPLFFIIIVSSFCIKTRAYNVTPYNMLPNNTSGVGQQYIDELKSRVNSNYKGFWGSYSSIVSGVPDDAMIVCKGETLWGQYQGVYRVLVPLEYNDPNTSSSISCNAFTTDQNGVVDSVTLNFNGYCEFWIGNGNYINNPYVNGYRTLEFSDNSSYQLVYCSIPIYCNGELVVNLNDEVEIPEFPSLPGIGTLSGTGGHTSGGNPFTSIDNMGANVFGHSSATAQTSGHSLNVTPNNASYDFTNASQNLLGQIVDNTNNIIGNTSSIFSGMSVLNGNLINGMSAIFNGISALNENVSDSAESIHLDVIFFARYVMEPYDAEEIEQKWAGTKMQEFSDSFETWIDLCSDNIDYIASGVASTDTNELVIPIDFRPWSVTTEYYGTITPYNQLYYMRFSFLDETKSLWQPILLSFIYLSLLLGLIWDSPNIIRGLQL